ncbi:C-type lectin domain family 4 member F-like [Penaeus japonicus]|uniref:C-type lectin domain family 4 member F-like n=1 Tax=Penaeus japonicus TaxID=27405 RepID=UPI001C70B099|nr:C-type lectin domain family 4 member F-like [Penaeus japonicus]
MESPQVPQLPPYLSMQRDQPAMQPLPPFQPHLGPFTSNNGHRALNAQPVLGMQQPWQNQQFPLVLLNLLASSVPIGLADSARPLTAEDIPPLLDGNLRAIMEMNRDLFEMLVSMQGHQGQVKARCREKKLDIENASVTRAFVDLHDSTVALQMALSESHLGKNPGKEVKSLIEMIKKELSKQQHRLKTLKEEEEEEEEEEGGPPPGCMEPFFAIGNECFYLGQDPKKSWHDALDACEAMGAHLARPKDVRKLVTVLRDFPGRYNRVWIGGSDEGQEGEWLWTSGERLNLHDWRPGQPSNRSTLGDEQDCLSLVTKNRPDSTMDDHSCWMRRAFLCEMDLEC